MLVFCFGFVYIQGLYLGPSRGGGGGYIVTNAMIILGNSIKYGFLWCSYFVIIKFPPEKQLKYLVTIIIIVIIKGGITLTVCTCIYLFYFAFCFKY